MNRTLFWVQSFIFRYSRNIFVFMKYKNVVFDISLLDNAPNYLLSWVRYSKGKNFSPHIF